MKKVITIVGARPQFIKAGVVSAEFRKREDIKEIMVHTGQHFDANMSDLFFTELGMGKPDINLGINSGQHGEMTGRMLIELEKVMLDHKPDIVLVYGDTNSTLAGALAAAKLHIPVAHVEAGLRSFNTRMPEEINRVMTDHLASWLFSPNEVAVSHLHKEGIDKAKVINVGDVMYDAALTYAKKATNNEAGIGVELDLNQDYLLVTIHRAENTDILERLHVIVESLNLMSEELTLIWPMHPRTRKVLQSSGLWSKLSSNIQIIEPQGYLDMIRLEVNAKAIVTDSGGVQKEAFFYRVPCITLRDETEWVETIELGWNRLAPPVSVEAVLQAIKSSLGTRGQEGNPYGQGNAAALIADTLCA